MVINFYVRARTEVNDNFDLICRASTRKEGWEMWINYYELAGLARDDIEDKLEVDTEDGQMFEPSMRQLAEWLLSDDGPYEELEIFEYDPSQQGPVSWDTTSYPLDPKLWL